MGEVKLDAGRWEEAVSVAESRLGSIAVRERITIERTTVGKLRLLMGVQQKIGETIGCYSDAAVGDTAKMREAASKIVDQDRVMAREFEGNGRNMVRFNS